jgi:DNA-binding NtrC family response regulator
VRALNLPGARPATGRVPPGLVPDTFGWEGTLEDVSARAVAHVERQMIEAALRECKWNKTRAAEKLGVSYKTLLTKIRALGLEE